MKMLTGAQRTEKKRENNAIDGVNSEIQTTGLLEKIVRFFIDVVERNNR